MAKKPTGYYDPTTGVLIQEAKPKKKRIWFWILLAIVIVIIAAANAGGNKESSPETGTTNQTSAGTKENAKDNEDAEKNDLSNVQTEYTLSAGQYYAGVDIPCGKFDLVAVSGDGNAITSNSFSGGVNGLFGGPGADRDMYQESYNGIKLPKGESIKIWGDLVVKIVYTKIDSGFTGRSEDIENTITLTPGNYDIGEDVPAGLYTIRIIEGSGNISCNVYDGGLNELMGAPGTDNSFIVYIPEFKNALFKNGDTLKVGDMTIELIPMVPGID